jgi:hypothetical protein
MSANPATKVQYLTERGHSMGVTGENSMNLGNALLWHLVVYEIFCVKEI